MSVHRIRLRHPWSCESQAEGVLWRRRFNRPTGLGPNDRVFVVLEGGGQGVLGLNEESLGRLGGCDEPQAFEVTDRLRPSNELALLLETAARPSETSPSVPPGEIRLEIRELGS